jgi:hypothetical protein
MKAAHSVVMTVELTAESSAGQRAAPMVEWTVVSLAAMSADYWVARSVVLMEEKSAALMAAM